MVRAFAAFGLPCELVADVKTSLETGGGSIDDVALYQALIMLASKLDNLRQITYTALKHHVTAASFAQQSLQSLQVSLDNLRVDVNGYFDCKDTYDEHGLVWESILHVFDAGRAPRIVPHCFR